MGSIHLERRPDPHGRSSGPDRNYQTICRSLGKFDDWLEVVVSARMFVVDLFLRPLRVCEHHGTRDRNVYAVSDCDSRRRRAAIPGGAFTCLLLQSGGRFDALRYDACSHLFWRRIHKPTNLVDARLDHVVDNYRCLESCWFHLVESSQTLVTHHGWIFRNTSRKENWHQGTIANRVSKRAKRLSISTRRTSCQRAVHKTNRQITRHHSLFRSD